MSLQDARRLVTGFVEYYNTVRLHSTIGCITPVDKLSGKESAIFAARDQGQRNAQNQTQPTQHPLISCHPNFFQLTLNQHKSNMNYLTSSALAEKSALETNNPTHTDMRSYVPEARPSPNQSNSQPLTKNKNLLEWIEKMAAIAQPAAIYWTVRRQITKPY